MSRPIPSVVRRLIALFTWRSRDRDMDQEMAFHLELLTREYLRVGMSQADAERLARRRFGDRLRLKEQGHDIRRTPVVENLARDVRHTLRGLRRSPGFAIAVILTLALGIGGNTAIFSIVNQLLLRPLPYPHGDQLLMVYESMSSISEKGTVSPANWLDWQRDSRTLQTLAAWRSRDVTMSGVGEPTQLQAQAVSSEFFPTLGVGPLLGRTLTAEDDLPNAPLVAVLSHRLWRQRFGSDPAVIGRRIQLNERPVEIVGVMPAGFQFVDRENGLWTAFRLDRNERFRETSGRFISVVARLRPDSTLTAARAEMTGIAQRLAATYAFNKNTTVTLLPLRDQLTGPVHTSLLVLYAAVGLLLSIACFNVANLLVARAASRRREIAIRTSLGAARSAIIRQLLVESLLLAGAGGALGIALARGTLDAIVAFAPADLLRVPELLVDRRVLAYAVGLTALTGVVVGLVPAVMVARRSIVAGIRSSGHAVTQSPRIRQVLVVTQVAMSVVLLCGAGLLVRTVLALNRADNGLDRHGVLTMEVRLPRVRYPPERSTAFYQQAVGALRALPGVESAAAADSLAVIGDPQGGTAIHRLGTPVVPINERPYTIVRVITPGYFHTLKIPILRGREFAGIGRGEPDPGFVVNEAFAKAYLSDIDPLRAYMSIWMQDKNPYLPILGVVGNVSEGSVREHPQPTVFYSHSQLPQIGMTLFVRARSPVAVAAPAVEAIHRLDPGLAVSKVRTFDDAIADSVARERLSALVSGGFALSGLLLASLGLYALLAYSVAERTKEIGLRIALGAQLRQLRRSVVFDGLRLVVLGAVIGIGGALLLFRLFGALLFGVSPYDVSTYLAVLLLLCTVAAVASYLPARRAARVEPLVALRQE